MGFKIKNSLTGEFEKLPILTLKGEKGETGGVEEYNKVDYMGNKYETLKQANDANVEYAVKTAIGEFNYLDYEGQHITALDSIAGQAKNAVVEGQTLVNLVDSTQNIEFSKSTNEPKEVYTINNASPRKINITVNSKPKYWNFVSVKLNLNLLKPNTKYLVKAKNLSNIVGLQIAEGDGSDKLAPQVPFVNNSYAIITTNDLSTLTGYQVAYVIISNFTKDDTITYPTTISLEDIMFIEYQDGMENWDIPYFEGMQSVKMPVLTTTGKNLFDVDNILYNTWVNSSDPNSVGKGDTRNTLDFTKVKPNQKIIASGLRITGAYGYDANKKFIEGIGGITTGVIIPPNVYYIRLTFDNTVDFSNAQLEYGSTSTTYEPYKSNILTVNEEVELRGIGDMKDTLDISTREKVERIGEIVLDGSETWVLPEINENTIRCYADNIMDTAKDKILYNDKGLKVTNQFEQGNTDEENIAIRDNLKGIGLRLSKTKATTIDELKSYLSQNPITIQYKLATESVKTVDLSDNHVYSYKDVTHYDCSSAEGSLVPTLSVKVPTDVQATIAQQRETIQTLNSENERLNQIQEALKASMLDSQVQLMNLSWDIDFEVFTLRESIAPKDFQMVLKTGSNIDKFSQAKFIIENDCPDLEKLNSQIEYYFSKDIFSQEQFEELTYLISIVKGGNGCEY